MICTHAEPRYTCTKMQALFCHNVLVYQDVSGRDSGTHSGATTPPRICRTKGTVNNSWPHLYCLWSLLFCDPISCILPATNTQQWWHKCSCCTAQRNMSGLPKQINDLQAKDALQQLPLFWTITWFSNCPFKFFHQGPTDQSKYGSKLKNQSA